MAVLKDSGRPKNAPNRKSAYVRDERISCRVTEGLNKTVAALIEECGYKSPSDVLHDAIQQLAYKKITDKKSLFWVSKIQ